VTKLSSQWPFLLNTGRVRDQWHTMTRTGLSPRLLTHIGEPYVEVHPEDAAALGLEQGTIATVTTPHGSADLRVLVHRNQQRGTLFAPIHWSKTTSSNGGVGPLIHGATDPFSGQPDSKATAATIQPGGFSLYGVALSRTHANRDGLDYWAAAPMPHGHVLQFALKGDKAADAAFVDRLLPTGERLVFRDAASGRLRVAILNGGRLDGILYVARVPKLPGLDWIKTQFALDVVAKADRRALLAGRAVQGGPDEGAIICVCFQVGQKRIEGTIAAGAATAQAIGAACGAGTNCGSCVPELKRLIGAMAAAHA
jgi:assimilatory nitrate reductase catalytic subunit